MVKCEFQVDYFDKEYLDSQFPDRKNVPHFQLSYGYIGMSSGCGGDPHESPSPNYQVISTSRDFSSLALNVLMHLKKPESLKTYQIGFSENASNQIGERGKRVLEEILALHNDFVTPRRR